MKIFIVHFIILSTFLFPVIVYSDDTHWIKTFPENEDISYFASIDNFDHLNIMAVCNHYGVYKRFLKSTDGGLSWNIIYREEMDGLPFFSAEDVSYPTKDFCVVSGDSASFFRTKDGGTNWESTFIEFGKYDSGGFRFVDMYDENHGIMASIFHMIITKDGFESWKEIPPFGDASEFAIVSVDIKSDNGITILTRNLDGSPTFNWFIYRTDDFGETWEKYQHPKYRVPHKHKLVNSLVGYEVGDVKTGIGNTKRDLIYKTIDGGKTWSKVLDTMIAGGSNFGLIDLDFYNEDNGIVVGNNGKIYWTHNGGKNWIYDSTLRHTELHGPLTQYVCMLDERTAVIATFEGKIYRGESGVNFIKTYDPLENNVRVIIGNSSAGFIIENEIAGELVLEIADLTGRAVYTGKHLLESEESRIHIDISGFVPGAYLYRVMQNNTIIGKGKFIVK